MNETKKTLIIRAILYMNTNMKQIILFFTFLDPPPKCYDKLFEYIWYYTGMETLNSQLAV